MRYSQSTIWNEILPSLSWRRNWHSKRDNKIICQYASLLEGVPTAVEIGSAEGQSAISMLKSNDLMRLYCVDFAITTALLVNLKAAEVNDRAYIVPCKSADAAFNWKGGEIDLLFIDATHTYESVMEDLESWSKHVKVGGYIVFHDADIPGILKAINEFVEVGDWAVVDKTDTMRVIRRTQ